MHTLGKSTVEESRRREQSLGGFLTVDSASYDGGAPVATLEERVFESNVADVSGKIAANRSRATQKSAFTVDLLGDWCKP